MSLDARVRSLLVCLACVVVALLAPARATLAGTSHFGVLGGVGSARFTGAENGYSLVFRRITAPAYGLAARQEVSPTLSIEPQFLWVVDGVSLGKSDHTNEAGAVTGTFNSLHVVERITVPVLFRFASPGDSRIKLVTFVGPSLGVIVHERDKNTGAVKSSVTHEVLRSPHLGYSVGAGLQCRAGAGQLELQGRFDGTGTLGHYYGNGVQAAAIRVLAGYSR